MLACVRSGSLAQADCAVAQAAALVGAWWTLLIVRDIAGGSIVSTGCRPC